MGGIFFCTEFPIFFVCLEIITVGSKLVGALGKAVL